MAEAVRPVAGVAVIGCGAWGRNHVRTLNTLGALRAVADANAETAKAIAGAAGVPARGLDDILSDTTIAALVIAVPDPQHAAMAQRALAAGKHVLVEKPMAMNVSDAEAMVAAARTYDRVLMCGHILRYHEGFRRLLSLLDDGAAGRAVHITTRRLHLTPGAPRHALWDLCPHDLSMILAAAGRMPDRVRAHTLAETVPGLPQAGAVALDFDDGLTAEISFSNIHPVKLHQFTVAGTAAQLVFEDSKPWPEKLALHRPGLDPTTAPMSREPIALEPGEPLAEQARAFLSAIDGGPLPPSGAEEGLRVVRVLAAAARAAESGSFERP
ncbi:MAG: putative dehydrogenase [Alphaproteobacteria bacterium]|jgi:predicted dehydrogenase